MMLLAVAMACATAFESSAGTEQALALFYGSKWFSLLLGLLGANVLAAMIVRYPFSKRQVGFVVTHVSILLILAGAWITRRLGVAGQLGLAEGQTASTFQIPRESLTIENIADRTRSSIDLDSSAFRGFEPVDDPKAARLTLDTVTVQIERYLPDSVETEQVVNDNPRPNAAVEVLLSRRGVGRPTWVFENRIAVLSARAATYRVIEDASAFEAMVTQTQPASAPASEKFVQIEYENARYKIPLEDCLQKAAPVGQTGLTVRVTRYLPHAGVGADGKLRNASTRPVNPAIEVELTGPEGRERRLAFARFPEFHGMRRETQIVEGLKLVFLAETTEDVPAIDLQVLQGPDDRMFVRFNLENGSAKTEELNIGKEVPTPWPGLTFKVLRRFDHARIEKVVSPVQPVREQRMPAVLVKVSSPQGDQNIWLRKFDRRAIGIDGKAYELIYCDKTIPLGFAVTLNDFRIGYYPGRMRPRSFESSVTISDAGRGITQSRVISMNHPLEYGGYRFYQSSYRQDGQQWISFLSVSRDPGQPIVFAGYFGVMAGMVLILITRAFQRRGRTLAG